MITDASPISDLIDGLGGAAAIAEATGNIKANAVRQWKAKRVIPRRAWPDLIRAFPDRVTLEALSATEARAA